jgi:hypothetical protein
LWRWIFLFSEELRHLGFRVIFTGHRLDFGKAKSPAELFGSSRGYNPPA